MRHLWHRKVGLIIGLAILGTVAWAGQAITISHASGSSGPALTVAAPNVSGRMATGFTEVAKAVTPAVVNITRAAEETPRTSRGLHDRFQDRHTPFDPWGPRREGMGSGVIVSQDGYILTNNHVVEGAHEVTVTLPDKREFKGTIVGRDQHTDLAVVKIDARNLPSVAWGDSSRLQVGEPVLAVGTPFGLTSTVTQGIVSALGRGRMGITQYEDFIQTDAAINPGNSGGALVNTNGELVGINTAIFSRSGGYQGIGFAVPTSMAKPVYESLVKTGKVVRGYLGVGIQDVTKDLAESFGLKESKGALVGEVKEGSPADRGGLKRGDVIIGYRGSTVEDPLALQRMVTKTAVGTDSTITVVRNGKERDLTVTIREQPGSMRMARADRDQGGHALAGLAVKDLDPRTARRLGLSGETDGIVVVAVEPGSGADRAGLTRGDVIREINRKPVDSVREFERIASDLEKDQRVLLFISRRGASLFVAVKV